MYELYYWSGIPGRAEFIRLALEFGGLGGLYYEDQKPEALRRAEAFRSERLPKFLKYFEGVLGRNPDGHRHMVGRECSTVDLSMFQVLAGLRYAFPRAMARLDNDIPRLNALHDRVTALPAMVAYLASDRRLPFNEQGLFRHYPALDG